MLLRFDLVERAVHWANSLLFTILILTALPLYFSGLSDVVGRRALIAEIHLYAGIALPIPIIAALAGPWGHGLRADLRRINIWTRGELRWLRQAGRTHVIALDKFNPGQKLNAIFTGAMIVVMLATGLIMHFVQTFPLTWRTGSTFVHDVVAFAVFFVIVGHIGFALTHPQSLRSMIRGSISARWARLHASRWLDEAPETAPH